MGLMFTRFLSASLFVPSILIWYLLFWGSATSTLPVLVHLPLSLPLMDCSTTSCPTPSFSKWRVCIDHLIPSLCIFSKKALSLSSADSWKCSCIWYCPWSSMSLICIRSLICRPKSICAGDLSRSLMGVFLYSRSAIAAFSPLSLRPVPTASLSILFILLTPVSALRLAWGL